MVRKTAFVGKPQPETDNRKFEIEVSSTYAKLHRLKKNMWLQVLQWLCTRPTPVETIGKDQTPPVKEENRRHNNGSRIKT